MKSKYQLGWIGIRASKVGKASKILKKQGWIKLDHADLSNRNAFNWIKFAVDEAEFMSRNWTELSNAGLVGIAVWLTDAQWEANSAITDAQWHNRALIESHFNSQWPTGRRA